MRDPVKIQIRPDYVHPSCTQADQADQAGYGTACGIEGDR
jgi:hypothetical protein